jgi:hypothetical protein
MPVSLSLELAVMSKAPLDAVGLKNTVDPEPT